MMESALQHLTELLQEELQYKDTEELLSKLLDEINAEPGTEKLSKYDKTLYLVRKAYIAGFIDSARMSMMLE